MYKITYWDWWDELNEVYTAPGFVPYYTDIDLVHGPELEDVIPAGHVVAIETI